TLNLMDGCTREALEIEVDTSLPGLRVVRVLEGRKQQGRKPKHMIIDNGTEFTSQVLDRWAYENGVQLHFITPGRPMENGYIESFNGKFRDECLNENWFLDLADARRKIGDWKWDYNHVRPHSALGYLTPMEFAKAWAVTGRGKDAPWKSPKTDFPSALGNPAKCAGFPLFHRLGGCGRLTKPDISLATKSGHFNLLRTLKHEVRDPASSQRLPGARHRLQALRPDAPPTPATLPAYGSVCPRWLWRLEPLLSFGLSVLAVKSPVRHPDFKKVSQSAPGNDTAGPDADERGIFE